MSFAQLKQELRRAVHDGFAVDATYQDSSMLAPVSLRVRWHTKGARPFGDIGGEGYAEVIENEDRVVFDVDDLAAKGICPSRGALVSFAVYGICVKLNMRDDKTGPVSEAWTVTR